MNELATPNFASSRKTKMNYVLCSGVIAITPAKTPPSIREVARDTLDPILLANMPESKQANSSVIAEKMTLV